ncbi:serine hydrolase [Nesterenkonia muleiensis]|uniref:serine hydrolase n=1 Tax=Nesterenkonia muleiensis TaxID=2282648 RepID=UPI00138FF11B|nr:serine hydrolase [Nesterenkonia muleiensis]
MADSLVGLSALASAAAVTLVLTACGSGDETHDGAPADAATATVEGVPGEQEEAAEPEPVDFPSTAVGEATEHTLEVLNAEEESTAVDWEGRLSEALLAEMDESELAETINQDLRPVAPLTATDYLSTDTASRTRLENPHSEFDLHIELDDEGLLTVLFLTLAQDQGEPAESFDEIEQRLSEMPAEVRLLVAEDDEELLTIDADEPAAMASIFKLWVLEALVAAIDEGETSWDDTVELDEQHISLPSGQLHHEDPGHELSVYDAAHAMISISDNTATDLLIDHVGRGAVEQSAHETGHHDPELLQPLLTTRDLFQLRWGDQELGLEYSESDEQRQREILDELAETPLDISASDLTPDDGAARGLEWFAAAEDIAAVHEALDARRDEHPELDSILGDNPGVFTETPWWVTLGHKDGASPGVLASSWRVEGADGASRTVVIQVSGDPEEVAADGMEYLHLAQNALELEPPS